MKLKRQIKSFLRPVAIIFTIILTISILFWWFAGSHTKDRLETNIFVTGAIVVLIGVLMRNSSRESTYGTMFSQPYMGSRTTMEDRLMQSNEDLERSWSDLMVLWVAGILAMLLSGLIHIIN
ncbi:MAG TPA: hypothetical protein DDX85_00400 [Nitrospiraceae bacterium]|nr:hypothetical protein [Nitrospiraceae bacterium]